MENTETKYTGLTKSQRVERDAKILALRAEKRLTAQQIADMLGTTKGVVQNIGYAGGVRLTQEEIDASRPNKYSQEIVDKVLELRKALKTENEIAAQVGISQSAVDHICMKNDVRLTPEQNKAIMARVRDQFGDEDKVNIRKWRTEDGLSLQEIANRLDKTSTAIKNFCAKHSIKADPAKAQANATAARTNK